MLMKPLRPVLENYTHTIRTGPALGMKRRGGLTFFPSPRTEEDRFLNQLNLEGKTVYDVGGNIGIMSLFFSRAVGPKGCVLTFEPNPDTIPLLEDNITVNDLSNVRIYNVAIGATSHTGELVVNRGRRGSGSMEQSIVEQYRLSGENRHYQVRIWPLDELTKKRNLPLPDFIKIDTEGYEYQCLLGMREIIESCWPRLYIEMHGASDQRKKNNAKKVFTFLIDRGYTLHQVQLGIHIDSSNIDKAGRGHLFCEHQRPEERNGLLVQARTRDI